MGFRKGVEISAATKAIRKIRRQAKHEFKKKMLALEEKTFK